MYMLARQGRLSFRYTVGWLVSCLVGISAGASVPLVQPLAEKPKVAPAALLSLGAVVLLLAIFNQYFKYARANMMSYRKSSHNKVATWGGHLKESFSGRKIMSIELTQGDVLVIVPAFNEAASIGNLISELKLLLYDILVVSDGSSDATAQVARVNELVPTVNGAK